MFRPLQDLYVLNGKRLTCFTAAPEINVMLEILPASRNSVASGLIQLSSLAYGHGLFVPGFKDLLTVGIRAKQVPESLSWDHCYNRIA